MSCSTPPPGLYAKILPQTPICGWWTGGILIIALTKLLGTTDYNGAGSAVIAAAMAGQALPWAFALKMLFTALTLGAGYKGGEIVPIFFTGATFGCACGPATGPCPLPWAPLWAWWPSSAAAPTARWPPSAWGWRVFGGQCLPLFALVCAVSYMLSSYFSLYHEQHFLHSKLQIGGRPLPGGAAGPKLPPKRKN